MRKDRRLDSDRLVGIVVGLAAEAQIARPLGWPVAVGGGTAAGAESAAQCLVDAGVAALVSFGLAGGLDPRFRPGALIVPSTVVVGNSHHMTDPELSLILGGATNHAVLGSDAIVSSVEEKRRLHDRTSAVAVDLESCAVVRAAVRRGIPFAVLRVICDPADLALPSAALGALATNGAISGRRVISALFARPQQLPALVALAVDTVIARRALRARVSEIGWSSV
jgi:adenosylhomocysteine nucleosidase